MKIAGRIFLKSGRDGPVRGGNPWVFSQAIARTDPAPLQPGDLIELVDSGGDLLGIGYYHPATTIAVRMLSFGAAPACADIIRHRIERALELRRRIVGGDTNCYRLINGDGDSLSGVVIDRYGDVFVLQLLTAGADRMRGEIAAVLMDLLHPRSIIERSAGAVRRQEGLEDRFGVIAGEPVDEVAVCENGIRISVDLAHGQKTGWFLDQRDNRAIVRRLARDAAVLDAYCYAGGFSLAALAGGARSVVAIDTSVRALACARRNLDLNGYASHSAEFIHTDAGRYLAEIAARTDGGRFGLVVLDPPPFARSLKDASHAGHLYTDLNTLAMRALTPAGYLMTFSCSIHFRGEDFARAVRIAHTKSGRKLTTLARLGPAPDHPVMLGHAEGEYLTGLLLAALD